MKRKFSFPKNKTAGYFIKWLMSFGLSCGITIVLMLILTLIQKKCRLALPVLEMLSLVLVIIVSVATAYFFVRGTKCKGLAGGGISALIIMLIKIISYIINGGMTGNRWITLIAIPAACLIGGILSANRKTSGKRKIGNLHKFAKN